MLSFCRVSKIFSMACLGLCVSFLSAEAADVASKGRLTTATIKFAHVVDPSSPKGLAAEFFKKRIEEMTNNAIQVKIFPNSQLFSDRDELEALQLNAIQMAAPSYGKFSALYVNQFEVFDLPFLFKNLDEVHKITMGQVGKELFKALEPRGVKGLAYWDNGFKSFSSRKPIHGPADMANLQTRIQASYVLEIQMRELKATPVALPFGEIIASFKSGKIDSAENPVSNFYSKKMYEYQPNLTMTGHGYLGYAVLINKGFWDQLSPELQDKVQKAIDETTVYANKVAAENEQNSLVELKKTGKVEITQPTADELAAFRKVLIPVHQKLSKRIGETTLQSVYSALDFKE